VGIHRYHVERDAVRDEHIPTDEIPFKDIKGYMKGTVSVDPPSIAAGATANVDVTISGLTTDHVVLLQIPAALEAGLVYGGCVVSAANTLRIRLGNVTTGAIDGIARDWTYLAWKP